MLLEAEQRPPNLPDYYQFMKATKYQTAVVYDVVVAEFVNKWSLKFLSIDTLLINQNNARYGTVNT